MLRKLALSLAVAGALSATQANALGLGEIRVNSALNEPLNAEIKLLQVRDLSPLQIQPRMADIDEFSLAGISKSRFLSDVSFDVRVMPDGGGVIRMKSTTPIREPFLNFLVEVNWPAGRLVREYTLLLDPPVFDPTPVPGGSSVQQAQSAAADMPQPAPTVPTRSRPSSPADTSNIKTRMDPNAEIYVDVHDTLWELALGNRPDSSVTPEQMMVALVRRNLGSFPTGNINVMKAGTVMRLPTMEEINRLTPAQARAEAARQTRVWRQGKSAAQPSTNETVAGGTGAGKPEAAKPEQMAEAVADATSSAEDAGQLKVVAPQNGDMASTDQSATADDASADRSESGSADMASGMPDSEQAQALIQRNEELENRLLVTQESISVLERDNTELNNKLDSIASQLDKLQRLVELKDRELAMMQQQLGRTEGEATGGGSVIDKVMQTPAYLGAIGAVIVALLLGLLLALRKKKEPKPEATAPVVDSAKTAQPVADTDVIPEVAVATTAAAAAATAAADDLAEEPVSAPVPDSVPVEEPVDDTDDDLDDLDLDLDMELDLDEGGAPDADKPSEVIGDEEFDLGIDEIEEMPPEEPSRAEQDDESLDSALDDILAGGREPEPESEEDEIDTGLDDLLSETSAADDFDDLPGALDEQEIEESVVEEPVDAPVEDSIGELEFAVDSIDAERAATEEEDLLDLPEDLEFELAKASEDPGEPVSDEDSTDELTGLDFAGGSSAAEEESASAETVGDDFLDDFFAEDAADKKEGLGTLPETSDDDIEPLNDGDIDLSEDDKGHLDTVTATADLYESFEIDDDIEELMQSSPIEEEPEIKTEPTPEPEPEEESETLADESFDDLDAMLASFEPDEMEPIERKPTQSEWVEDELTANIEHDLETDLDAELDSLLSSTDDDIALEEESAEESEDEPDLLDSMNLLDGADEIETKLDLARAYIEMEDTDGARDILNEILGEGDQNQRLEAERLLETLS